MLPPPIDFGAIGRPQFAAPSPRRQKPLEQSANPTPAPHVARLGRRRMARLKKAADALAHVPTEGEALHALMTGEYDLMHLIVALLAHLGRPCEHLRIATLSYNGRNLAEILRLLDGGLVSRVSLVTSSYFTGAEKELWEETLREFRSRASARASGCRSHCKVVCVHLDDGRKYAIEGSANLRTNKNVEQFCLIRDAGVHDWHASWIDEMVTKHAQDR